MTPAGIEPATFWFIAQHLNHCATAVHGLRLCNYENNGIDGAFHLARSGMILKYCKLHKIKPVYKILFLFTTQNLIQIGPVVCVVLHALNGGQEF